VIEWLPTASAAVVNVACPLPLSVPVPSVVGPSLKVTVPVGVLLEPDTLAVKATAAPNVLGFEVEPMVVVLALALIVSVNTGDVLPV
jgi:hypothetical protein